MWSLGAVSLLKAFRMKASSWRGASQAVRQKVSASSDERLPLVSRQQISSVLQLAEVPSSTLHPKARSPKPIKPNPVLSKTLQIKGCMKLWLQNGAVRSPKP